MVDFLVFAIRFVVSLANAFRDDFWIALCVACVLAVCTLHAGRVFEKFSAKSATHDVVELLLDKFVALLLVDFLFLLADGTLSIETNVERPSASGLFLEAHS